MDKPYYVQMMGSAESGQESGLEMKTLQEGMDSMYKNMMRSWEEAVAISYSMYIPVPTGTGKWLAEQATPAIDPAKYPHKCPHCAGPAYLGAVAVDCAGKCSKETR